MNPRPRHSKWGRSSNTSAHRLQRAPVALRRAPRACTGSRPRRGPRASCRSSMWTDCRMSSGSKPGDHDRLAVLPGDELVRPARRRPSRRGRGRGSRRAAGRASPASPCIGGTIVTWLQMQREVLDALRLRALSRQRGGRRGRLEADREEHDLAVRARSWRSAARPAASRPSARRRPPPWPPAASRAGPGTRIMSPKRGEDHARLWASAIAVVDAAHRDHAHRAAGAVHQLDVLRQQVLDAVLVDRVGVAAAHLHQLVVAAGLDGVDDLAGEHAAEVGVAEFVHESHSRRRARQGGAGVDQQRVARRRRRRARPRRCGGRRASSSHSEPARPPSIRQHPHRHRRRRRT